MSDLPRILRALHGVDPGLAGLDLMRRLRSQLAPDEARRAADLHRLRARARGKLADAERLLLTELGLEQATDRRVAAARAARIARRGGGRWVWDATAGIGGDALALVGRGLAVLASDRDAERAAYLAHNLGAVAADPGRRGLALRADALRPPLRDPGGGILLLDPDRRPAELAPGPAPAPAPATGPATGSAPRRAPGHAPGPAIGSGRRGDPQAWAPSLADALGLAARFAGAVIKLPPAFDPAGVPPPAAAEPRAWQWTSLAGELKEVALWLGCLAGPGQHELHGPHGLGAPPGSPGTGAASGLEREAQALDREGRAARLVGVPVPCAALDEAAAGAAAFLAEPDPAVIRSGLLGNLAAALGLRPVQAEIAYLGGAEPPRAGVPAGLYRAFRVLGSSPLDPKRVRRLLAEHDVGPVTVKKRGHPEPADKLARRLRGPGRNRGLLLVARLERHHRAWLVVPWSDAERRSPNP